MWETHLLVWLKLEKLPNFKHCDQFEHLQSAELCSHCISFSVPVFHSFNIIPHASLSFLVQLYLRSLLYFLPSLSPFYLLVFYAFFFVHIFTAQHPWASSFICLLFVHTLLNILVRFPHSLQLVKKKWSCSQADWVVSWWWENWGWKRTKKFIHLN